MIIPAAGIIFAMSSSCNAERIDECKDLGNDTSCENCCHMEGYSGYAFNATKSEPCGCL